MATAKKLPSGNYRVLVYTGTVDGKRRYKSFTHADKWMAESMAASYMTGKVERGNPENMTVGEAIDKYIASKDAVLSPSTVRSYKSARRADLQNLMGVRLSDLTQELVQHEVNREASIKAPKTIRNAHGILVAVLKVYHPRLRLTTSLPPKTRPKLYVPSQEEIRALLQASAGTDIEIPIALGAYLGLRRSEICALTMADVDATQKTVSINKAMVLDGNNTWRIKPPKSYSGFRTIPLPEYLANKLSSLAISPGERVTALHPNALTDKFERLQRRVYGEIIFRFHDLRHYNASVMLAQNVPNRYAQERLGHATDNMLKNVYQHLFQDKQREISNTLNDYFDSLMQHEKQHENPESK